MKHVLYATTVLAMTAAPALANPHQVNNGGNGVGQSQVWGDGSSANTNQAYGGNSRSNATAYGSSRSSAYGGTSNSTATGGAGGSSRSYSGGGRGGDAASSQNVTVNNGTGGGGGTHVEAPAPDIMLPNIAGGMNDCLGGVGFGGTGKPGGGLFSYTWEMHDCRMRSTGQMLWNAGYRMEAIRVWCRIPEVRDAFKGTPEQCPADGGPVVEPVSAPASDKVTYSYDWCYTASPGERKQHKECDIRTH